MGVAAWDELTKYGDTQGDYGAPLWGGLRGKPKHCLSCFISLLPVEQGGVCGDE